jgi:transcriptional regulator with XRE-family HTH domain
MFNEQMELTTATKARRNLAISEAMSTDRLVKAARAKNMSLRGLARKMGISAGSLIDYRNGVRAIPKRHADWIERELGLPPSRAVWPRGVDE